MSASKRFISYVGKVNLDHFKDSKLQSLVKQYCENEEKRVCVPRLRLAREKDKAKWTH